jgi:hypothetical protein
LKLEVIDDSEVRQVNATSKTRSYLGCCLGNTTVRQQEAT